MSGWGLGENNDLITKMRKYKDIKTLSFLTDRKFRLNV